MKKLMVVILLCISGCSSIEMSGSKTLSAITKIDRDVTVYSANGSVLYHYQGPIYIEYDGAFANFMVNNKRVTVSGTVVIKEY